MPGKQRIELYCLCWNDARMLPFFFRHYDPIVDRYFVYDNGSTDGSLALLKNHGRVEVTHFDVPGDSFCEEECRLCDTIWRDSKADWVIVTDLDEHLYRPNLTEYLSRCTDEGVTAIQSIGYEMVSDTFPSADRPLLELVTHGVRGIGHDRLCIFNPRALTATNYTVGRHAAIPEGQVVWPEWPEVLLLHFKQLGLDYLIKRSSDLRKGLKSKDVEQGWGVHYTWTASKITEAWQELKALSGPVPGLGSLNHIGPEDFFAEERLVALSGLFDREWYLKAYPDIEEAGVDPFSHYSGCGWNEGRQPNFYFQPEWYRANCLPVQTTWRNPFCDYVTRGEKENARPSPRFDTGWYRGRHGLAADESPLRHYLKRRRSGVVSPLPEFDAVQYCRDHLEVLEEGKDPFEDHCMRLDAPPERPRKRARASRRVKSKRAK